MTELLVPNHALVLLIGAAGAGKTTVAARHFPPDAVLSSDAFRARFGTGEADQTATRTAFAALHRELEGRLAAGRLTVIDATNVTAGARSALVRRGRAAGRPVVAIVLDLPADIVLGRNAARGATTSEGGGRSVPEVAVRRHLDTLASVTDRRLLAEGIARVCRLRTPAEVARLRVVFDPQAGSRTRPKGRARSSTQTPLRR